MRSISSSPEVFTSAISNVGNNTLVDNKLMELSGNLTPDQIGVALRYLNAVFKGGAKPSFVSAIANIDTGILTLSFNNPSAVAGFILYRNNVIVSQLSGVLSVDISDLDTTLTYEFKICPFINGVIDKSAISNTVYIDASSWQSYANDLIVDGDFSGDVNNWLLGPSMIQAVGGGDSSTNTISINESNQMVVSATYAFDGAAFFGVVILVEPDIHYTLAIDVASSNDGWNNVAAYVTNPNDPINDMLAYIDITGAGVSNTDIYQANDGNFKSELLILVGVGVDSLDPHTVIYNSISVIPN